MVDYVSTNSLSMLGGDDFSDISTSIAVLDASVVHKTGNLTESINGLKTFTDNLVVNNTNTTITATGTATDGVIDLIATDPTASGLYGQVRANGATKVELTSGSSTIGVFPTALSVKANGTLDLTSSANNISTGYIRLYDATTTTSVGEIRCDSLTIKDLTGSATNSTFTPATITLNPSTTMRLSVNGAQRFNATSTATTISNTSVSVTNGIGDGGTVVDTTNMLIKTNNLGTITGRVGAVDKLTITNAGGLGGTTTMTNDYTTIKTTAGTTALDLDPAFIQLKALTTGTILHKVGTTDKLSIGSATTTMTNTNQVLNGDTSVKLTINSTTVGVDIASSLMTIRDATITNVASSAFNVTDGTLTHLAITPTITTETNATINNVASTAFNVTDGTLNHLAITPTLTTETNATITNVASSAFRVQSVAGTDKLNITSTTTTNTNPTITYIASSEYRIQNVSGTDKVNVSSINTTITNSNIDLVGQVNATRYSVGTSVSAVDMISIVKEGTLPMGIVQATDLNMRLGAINSVYTCTIMSYPFSVRPVGYQVFLDSGAITGTATAVNMSVSVFNVTTSTAIATSSTFSISVASAEAQASGLFTSPSNASTSDVLRIRFRFSVASGTLTGNLKVVTIGILFQQR